MLIPNKHSGYQAGIRLYPGGKGGSSAPPPDPALIAAQIRSMGIQDSAIQKMMDLQQEMMPLQKEQMDFGLKSAKTAYDQSQEDRTWMLDRRGSLSGLQDKLVSDAKSFNEGDRADQLAGQAGADVTSSFDNAAGIQSRNLSRTGVNPSSGKALAASNETSIARAVAGAGAQNKARDAARTEGYAMTDRATNALAGYPTLATGATGAGAGYGTAGTGIVNNGVGGMYSGLSGASTVAGQMGSNATTMFGAQANYKNQQDQLSNQGDPLMSMLGQGAMMYAMKSDVNAKEGIQQLEPGQALEMIEEIPVSEWQYKPGESKDGGQRHVGPMAQDVNQVVGERAAPGGTKIDLITMNGLNMAAIKDLSAKVDQLSSGRLAFRGGLSRKAA